MRTISIVASCFLMACSGEQGGASGDGSSGEQGPVGPAGPAGAQGGQGPTGPQGPQGAQGAQGPQGPTGASGATGPQGPAGPAGATGSTGPQGPAGSTGPQGLAGAVGATGAQGPAGLVAMAFNANGDQLGYWLGVTFSTGGSPNIGAAYITHGDAIAGLADGFIMPTGWSKFVDAVWYVNNDCTGTAYVAGTATAFPNWLYADQGGQVYAATGQVSGNIALQSYITGPGSVCTAENLSGTWAEAKIVGEIGTFGGQNPAQIVVK